MTDPVGAVVEGVGGEATGFGKEVVLLAWEVRFYGGVDEGFTQEGFGGSVVGGCVECADAVSEGVLDELGCVEGIGILVILYVKGACAED